MSFAGGRDGSKGFMKRVTSTLSIKKKQNKRNDPKSLLPRSRSTGSTYESMRLRPGKRALTENTKRTKSAGVSLQPRRQKIDESGKQFTKLRCFDDSDSIWLSSDCTSSSSLLGERRVSVSFHFSLDERVVSWLSNASRNQEDSISTKENHQKCSKKAKCSSENNNKTCPSKSCEESYASPELTLQSHEVSFSLESELVLKEGCKRKLMFNGPGSCPKQARSIGNKKIKNQQPIKNGLKRNNSLPSSLRNSSEVVPIHAAEESVEIHKKTPKKLIMTRKSRTFLEDDFALMNDFSIENVVGLCEFRGREGIDSDFNTDGFLFQDSL